MKTKKDLQKALDIQAKYISRHSMFIERMADLVGYYRNKYKEEQARLRLANLSLLVGSLVIVTLLSVNVWQDHKLRLKCPDSRLIMVESIFTPLGSQSLAQGQTSENEGNLEPVTNKPLTVEEEIIKLSAEYGIKKEDALRIAKCESNMGRQLFNKRSSAKGIYQFINKTWANYCEGDVLNQSDNIKCFMRLYPSRPHWWECK